MFKTMVTVLVSLIMTASAAMGLNVEDSAWMSDIRSQIGQTAQVETQFAQGDSGIYAGAEGSAEMEPGLQASQDDEGVQGGSAEASGEGEASARLEAEVDLSMVKKLWDRIQARLEAVVDRILEKGEEIRIDFSMQGKGSGSLKADGGEAGSASVGGGASGSGKGPLSTGDGRNEENAGFSIPFLGGTWDAEIESETGFVIDTSGR